MPELFSKPIPFKAGSRSVSAGALNKLVHAMVRQITGGVGINVNKFGDRIVISLGEPQQGQVSTSALVVIVEEKEKYLVCDKDGALINVAKPWGLRNEVDFPVGPDYVYHNPQHRTATLGGETEEQFITPSYQVGEELLAKRLPSSRIDDEAGKMIVWIDENLIGRCWAAENEEEE